MYQTFESPQESELAVHSGHSMIAVARTMLGLLVASLMVLALLSVLPAGIDPHGGLFFAVAEADDDVHDDEADAEAEDDGSNRLTGRINPALLTPITAAEEETLLGNWGDAEDEDED